MDNRLPPPFASPASQKRRAVRVLLVVLSVCFLAFVVIRIAIPVHAGFSVFKDVLEGSFKSRTDRFRVTVLEVKTAPDYFMERLRVRCERDMEAGIWVTDLKQGGLFETHGPNGETLYREGRPYKVGQSGPVRADAGFSTCEILFSVGTTSTNTVWHSRISTGVKSAFSRTASSDGVDTTLPGSTMVSGVNTNWTGSYERGSGLPLANLGDYKILLLIK